MLTPSEIRLIQIFRDIPGYYRSLDDTTRRAFDKWRKSGGSPALLPQAFPCLFDQYQTEHVQAVRPVGFQQAPLVIG